MKTLMFFMLMSFTFCLQAQDEKLPETVLNDFNTKYSKVSGLEWKFSGDQYVLEYYRSGSMFTSIYDKNGAWMETSEVIADMDIPPNFQKYISTTYPSAEISYSEKVEAAGNQKFFRVTLMENDKEFSVKSDLNGNLIAD